MSIHPSLRSSNRRAAGALRNVLKRYERVQHLMASDQWPEGRSVYGLPKIKQTKIKARKAVKDKEDASASAEKPATPPPGTS